MLIWCNIEAAPTDGQEFYVGVTYLKDNKIFTDIDVCHFCKTEGKFIFHRDFFADTILITDPKNLRQSGYTHYANLSRPPITELCNMDDITWE